MECNACGPGKDYQILYACPICKQQFCDMHIAQTNHRCMGARQTVRFQSSPQSRIPFGTIPPGTIGQFFQQAIRREPTKEEYEQYLRSNPQVLTSGRESIDLMGAMFLLTFVISFRPALNSVLGETGAAFSLNFALLVSLVIAPAFILHELAHKYAAIYYGKYARFTLVRQMALITFLVGLIGFGIAGPGATMIIGRSSKRENGIFAAAGPAINFVLSLLSLFIVLITPNVYVPIFDIELHGIFFLSMYINSFLGLFNLIPFSLLDGKKIYNWQPTVWIGLVLANLSMFLLIS